MSMESTAKPAAPYRFSIVAVSRNDNHGGDMTARMQAFVCSLLYWARQYDWRAELLLVDWNPPADRPPLSEALPAPGPNDCLAVRYITVPPQLHQQYRMAQHMPLLQMIGKNVGIRRARSPFVLCTNVDIVFSDALARWLAEAELDPQAVYRCNRMDVPADLVHTPLPDFEQQAFARRLRVLGKSHRYPYLLRSLPDWLYSLPAGAGRPVLSLFHAWDRWVVHGLQYSRLESRLALLDTMACGDFTLMAKTAWEQVGGYLEADLYSLHIDSLALGMALAAGYRQVLLKNKQYAYHLDHASGWEFMDPVERLQFVIRRPSLSYSEVWEALKTMMARQTITPLNPPDWGLLDHDLPELTLHPH